MDPHTRFNVPREVMDAFGKGLGFSLLVKGDAGAGKTIFSLELLASMKRRESREHVVYVSSRVSVESLQKQVPAASSLFEGGRGIIDVSNVQLLDRAKRKPISFQSAGDVLEFLIQAAGDFESTTMVIDSWDSVSTTLRHEILRNTREEPVPGELENLIAEIVRQKGIKLVLIAERDDTSMLDYIVDGTIALKKSFEDNRRVRELIIDKMRGIEITNPAYLYTLDGGTFTIFHPQDFHAEVRYTAFPITPDDENHYSSGIPDLDRILHGGYPKRALIVLELGENVSMAAVALVLGCTITTFAKKNRGVAITPPIGFKYLEHWVYPLGDLNEFYTNVRFFLRSEARGARDAQGEEPYIRNMQGDFDKDQVVAAKVSWEFIDRNATPMLSITAIDNIEYSYGVNKIMKSYQFNASAYKESNLFIALISSQVQSGERIKSIADIHLKLVQKHDQLLLYGLKPSIPYHVLVFDRDEYMTPKVGFVPVV